MKSFLKRLFPIMWLKAGFLLYNRFKIATFDRLFFSVYRPQQAELLLYEKKNPFLELGIDLQRFTPEIRNGFSRWTDPEWLQDQYILSIRHPVLIEAKHGWGVVGARRLVYMSLGFAHAPHVHKPAISEVLGFREEESVERAVSLRDTGEENFFHFFNDIVPKLYLLQERGLLHPDARLIVSQALWARPYFQEFLHAAGFFRYAWLVQGTAWIRAKQIIFCKPYTHTLRFFEKSARLVLEKIDAAGPTRIFLTRSQQSMRFLENEDEVFSILAEHGFEKIDTAKMPLIQQAALFRAATHVVAVHGAGLTNLIFRFQQPLHVLEIFHPNAYLPFHYLMLSSMFGFDYQACQGYPGSFAGRGGFYLRPVEIEVYCAVIFAR